jgi:hypothetical protein
MHTVFLAVLLAAVFACFAPAVQDRLQKTFHARQAAFWCVPVLLTAVFSAAAASAGALSPALGILVLAYTAAPVACAYAQGPGFIKQPSALDFGVILLLWLPLEFAAGAGLVPRPAQGFLHSVGYGIAILLGLILFIGFRSFPGMKYNLPRRGRDLLVAIAGFAIVAPVLIAVGIPIGFIPPPHGPARPAGAMAAAMGVIFAGTALPEEILFRSLIQNFLALRLGGGPGTLLLASFIFGCAHLDNGPQAVPNWRYMILATIAGVAYGRVFQKSGTVVAPAIVHTLVDWTKHFFF